MTTEERFERIEKYLAGQLSVQEREAFEKLRQEDPAFAQEIALHARLQETLQGEKIHAFRQAVREVDRQWQPKGRAGIRRLTFSRVLAVAATLLLLVAASWWLFRQPDLSKEALFANYFEPYAMVLNQRSGSGPDLQEEAIQAYQQQRYAEAASIFEQLAKQDPANLTSLFYYALSTLAAGDTPGAIEAFQTLTSSPEHLLKEQSQWYLALAFLKAEKLEASRSVLQSIKPGMYRFEDAQALLKKLKDLPE